MEPVPDTGETGLSVQCEQAFRLICLGLGPDFVHSANHVYLGIEERPD